MVDQWLFALEANIVCASAIPEAATVFCAEMKNLAFPEQLLCTHLDRRLGGLDSKLYAALIHNLMSKDTEDSHRILHAIRQCVTAGSGRQAVRVVIADFATLGARGRQLSIIALHNVKP